MVTKEDLDLKSLDLTMLYYSEVKSQGYLYFGIVVGIITGLCGNFLTSSIINILTLNKIDPMFTFGIALSLFGLAVFFSICLIMRQLKRTQREYSDLIGMMDLLKNSYSGSNNNQ